METILRNVHYSWTLDREKTLSRAEQVAKAHGWPLSTAVEMTDIVGPDAAVEMTKQAVAWRTGKLSDTPPENLTFIHDKQKAVALSLGMSATDFEPVWDSIYSKRLLNPANSHHMLKTRAYASPTYGRFLSAIPTAECMLFTRGIAKNLDGNFGRFGVNRFGGTVAETDPSIVWCEMDTGCRFDRDRGHLLLRGILEDIKRFDDTEENYLIFVYGAGYLTEMICTGFLDDIVKKHKHVTIDVCDPDRKIYLRPLLNAFMTCPIHYDRAYLPNAPTCIRLGAHDNVEIFYFREDMRSMQARFETLGVHPHCVIAKGVMSYNLDPADDGLDNAHAVVESTLLGLAPGGEIRFDFQLHHPVNLRNGLSFAWGFPVEPTMTPYPGGITLLTEAGVSKWISDLQKALYDHHGFTLPDDHIELATISDDLGVLTTVVRLKRPNET